MKEKKSMTSLFKIRNISENTFSTGGSNPSFNDKGKTWTSLGHLKTHLSTVKRKRSKVYNRNIEIVEYTLTPKRRSKLDKTISISFENIEKVFYPEKWKAKLKKEAARKESEAIENAKILEHQKEVFDNFEIEKEARELIKLNTKNTPVTSSTSTQKIPW